jgi:hypothetical protein
VFFLRHLLNKPDTVLALVVLQILLGMLWWGWTEIPLFFREAIHKMLQRDAQRQSYFSIAPSRREIFCQIDSFDPVAIFASTASHAKDHIF